MIDNSEIYDVDPADYDGCGQKINEKVKKCPECGNDVEYDTQIYLSSFGDILGCQNCIDVKNAEDCDFFNEDEYDIDIEKD